MPLASVNGALEGLTRALALEFGPRLRVNALSPGFCDTERFDRMEPLKKAAMLANTADSLPLKRVGRPEDMGLALDFLLSSPFTTGVVREQRPSPSPAPSLSLGPSPSPGQCAA